MRTLKRVISGGEAISGGGAVAREKKGRGRRHKDRKREGSGPRAVGHFNERLYRHEKIGFGSTHLPFT